MVPVLLALHLLRRDDPDEPHTMGFDLRRPGQDLVRGAVLAAVIGLPGLALYAAAKALDLNTTIAAANLASAWWTIPVLVLAAAQNAVLEEVIMVGYLFKRWGQAGWGRWQIILTSAVIRGTYHLYQGFGGFVGNVVMGLVFGWAYQRWGRSLPLIVAQEVYGVVAILSVFATVLPLWLMAEGLKRIGANQLSLVGCIGPLATLVFAWAFLGEGVTPLQFAGAVLVLGGVLIISLKPQAVARSR